jgi:hypothetical protein
MEDFYFYTVVIALIILILILAMIGIILSYGNESKVFPPIQNEGPDYWTKATPTEFGNLKGINVSGINLPSDSDPTNFFRVPLGQTNPGKLQTGTDSINTEYWIDACNNTVTPAKFDDYITGVKIGLGNTTSPYKYYIQMKGNDTEWGNLYPGMTTRCAKQKWALDRVIVWDGVTNYNGCTSKADIK